MQTVHLTEDHVVSYLRDFASRVVSLGDEAPQVWAVIGASGAVLAKQLAKTEPRLRAGAPEVLLVTYDRSSGVVSFADTPAPEAVLKGKRVLLVDSTVLTGGTLSRIVGEINHFSPAAVTSYALAVRRGAKIRPNRFGFLIGDHDRVHLPARIHANNCLHEYGVYRKLSEDDCARQKVETGAAFMDKFSWEDHWWEVCGDTDRHVYLHELDGVICGFVILQFRKGKTCLVDEVGIDVKFQGKGLGGHLMRWAEHCARHRNCKWIELWAVDTEVGFYEHRGFVKTPLKPRRLSDHEFYHMSRKLLYHRADDDTLEMGG